MIPIDLAPAALAPYGITQGITQGATHGVRAGREPGNGPGRRSEAGDSHAFDHALGNAMRGRTAIAQPAADDECQSDEVRSADTTQLPLGLQVFVDSMAVPVTATAVPVSAATVHDDAAAATSRDTSTPDLAALQADPRGSVGSAGNSQNKRNDNSFPSTASQLDSEAAPALRHDDASDVIDRQTSSPARLPAAIHVAPAIPAPAAESHAVQPAFYETMGADPGTGASSLPPTLVHVVAATGALAAGISHASATPLAHVAPPLHAPQWQDAFGQQVLWMARNEQQLASLTVNPPDLGPLRVTLSIADGQATAAFVSLQPEVRQAIQDAMPRLKELFADAGLPLQQASVSSGDTGSNPRQAAEQLPADAGTRRSSAQNTSATDEAVMHTNDAGFPVTRVGVSLRLIDLFA